MNVDEDLMQYAMPTRTADRTMRMYSQFGGFGGPADEVFMPTPTVDRTTLKEMYPSPAIDKTTKNKRPKPKPKTTRNKRRMQKASRKANRSVK